MRIFYDVDTQNDFMNANGALTVPNAEAIKPNLEKLTRYALSNGILILGSVDLHFGTPEYQEREGELSRWGGPFPDHCMYGTEGQKKIPQTTIKGILYLPSHEIELPSLDQTAQIIFEKQSYDVFKTPENKGGNANIEKVLNRLSVTKAIVYGVATDYCVKAVALGLRQRGIEVYVVTDAIEAVNVNQSDRDKALKDMEKAKVQFITMEGMLK